MKKTLILAYIIALLISNIAFADDKFEYDETENLPLNEVSIPSSNIPKTNSKHIIVIDRKTLLPLYEKDSYSKVAMASTTKIMTCILALENCSLEEIVTVSKSASNVSGSTLGLQKNMKISINDLIYGLMLRSGNDCAVAIAEHISGSLENFSTLMNQKAKELNLENTNFVTPHGLDDENHYTTAYDLAILTDYALKNPKFKKIVSTKKSQISFNGNLMNISNTNELLGNLDGVYGVKTGFTFEAGRCLVSACSRNNFDIIVVVLGADTKKIRTQDSINLINYIYKNFSYINILSTVESSFNNYLTYFENNHYLEKTITSPKLKLDKISQSVFPLRIDGNLKLSTKIYTISKFNSEIKKGESIGKLSLYNNNTLLCEVDIILENEIIKNDWKYYFKKILSNNNLYE